MKKNIGDVDFQKYMLSVLLTDLSFSTKVIKYVKEDYFTLDDYKDAFVLFSDYFNKYNICPSFDIIKNHVTNNGGDKYLCNIFKELYEIDIKDTKYIKDRLVEFAKTQEWRLLSLDIDGLLKNRNFDELKQRSIEISSIGIDKSKDIYDYFDMAEVRITKLKETIRTVGTGIIGVDDCLDNGGLSDGELGLVVAPPSGGKSTTLISIGRNCLMNGYNVFHFTEELSDKKTARRYDQSILGMSKQEIMRTPNRTLRKLMEISDEIKKKLYIKEHPSNSVNVNTLCNEIEKLIDTRGVKPDLIIVDYADLLLPSRQFNQRRFELEDIYRGLRGMMQKLETRGWTASQSQSETIKGVKHIGMEHLAESIVGKAAILDVIVSINQDINQKKLKRGELFIAKNRDDERDIAIPVHIDWSKMQICDLKKGGNYE